MTYVRGGYECEVLSPVPKLGLFDQRHNRVGPGLINIQLSFVKGVVLQSDLRGPPRTLFGRSGALNSRMMLWKALCRDGVERWLAYSSLH